MAKLSLDALLNPKSEQIFTDLLNKYKVPVDSSHLFEKNQYSYDLLEKIYHFLHLNIKTVESNLIQNRTLPNLTVNKKQTETKFFNQLRIFCLVKALYIHSLTLDALKIYSRNKKIKKYLAQLRAFIIRVSAANHARLIAEYEAEKNILDQRLKEVTAALQYENVHAEAEKQMLECFQQIQFFNEEIDHATQERDRLLDQHSANFYHLMVNYQDQQGNTVFANIPKEKMLNFAQDYEFQDYKLEKKIRNNQEREEKKLAQIEDIDRQITQRRVDLSLQTKQKRATGIYAASMTTMLNMNKDVSNDPKIQELMQKKNELRSQVSTLEAERSALIKRQNDLPLILARDHQLQPMVEILVNKNSASYQSLLNTFHQKRDEKRAQSQEQRLLRRNYRNQIKQLQDDANQIHEIDHNARESQKGKITALPSLAPILADIQALAEQSTARPNRLRS